MQIKKFPLIVTLLGIVGLSLMALLPKASYRTASIEIGKVKITAMIADSPQKRALGLGGRASLDVNEGMLFYFDRSSYPGIWMKGMRFPIDIIWLKQGVIVDIAPQVPAPHVANEQLPTYSPGQEADQVLEVNSGFCAKNDLKIDDKLVIKVN